MKEKKKYLKPRLVLFTKTKRETFFTCDGCGGKCHRGSGS